MIKTIGQYWRVMRLAAMVWWKSAAVDAFVFFTIIIQPLIIALLGLWMLRDSREDAAIFVVVGSGMAGLWSSIVFISAGSIDSERWDGTLETLVIAPMPLWVSTAGTNMANVIQSLLSMVTAYTIASLTMGYALTVNYPIYFVISLFFTVIAFIAFGLVIAPIFLLNPAVSHFKNGLEFPVYLLCGFLFPIALLPGWTTPISYLLTPYWAARALHESAHGDGDLGIIASSWVIMLISTGIYLLIVQRLFRVILYKVREDGSVTLV